MAKQHFFTGVMGLAVNDKGQFLISQRNEPTDPEFHKKWQIPGGGVEFGETPEQTLAREMQEELQVSCEILFPHPMAGTSVVHDKETLSDLHITLLCYVVSIGNQTPKIGDPETLAWKWATPKELHDLEALPLTTTFVEGAEQLLRTHIVPKP